LPVSRDKDRTERADAIATVRLCLWGDYHFSTSGNNSDVVKVPRSLLERLTDAVCYAAWMDKVELSFLPSDAGEQLWRNMRQSVCGPSSGGFR
jgi:hypothetical protein